MSRSAALALVSLASVVGLPMVARASHAASSEGVLLEVHMRTIQHAPGATARATPTLSGRYCEPTIEDYARSMAKMILRHGKTDECMKKYNETAGTFTFTKNCRIPIPTATHGVFRVVNGSTIAGTVAIGYLAAGRVVMLDEEYSGKRVGTCAYPQPTK